MKAEHGVDESEFREYGLWRLQPYNMRSRLWNNIARNNLNQLSVFENLVGNVKEKITKLSELDVREIDFLALQMQVILQIRFYEDQWTFTPRAMKAHCPFRSYTLSPRTHPVALLKVHFIGDNLSRWLFIIDVSGIRANFDADVFLQSRLKVVLGLSTKRGALISGKCLQPYLPHRYMTGVTVSLECLSIKKEFMFLAATKYIKSILLRSRYDSLNQKFIPFALLPCSIAINIFPDTHICHTTNQIYSSSSLIPTHLFFIPLLLHPTSPSSNLSFIQPLLHPTSPSSNLSFIQPLLHLTYHSSNLSFI
ncbi:uncharacterized protein BDR25DRAFT_352001 [Lindgomyces ingoldianus]|uniref:Uncharacterized protein n=1 Tax=Lindgomyces ingoldianus TaxID=673940 RepID=A0ACB6R5U6_9PLEO|nr:uncharacterized protein BDR25DRAFT_352001 [Lindgomyces ingoldianus]KAF2474450.1 hypothetical protein BDR25DRAFT_352001 [Lindgomyces ingoldianus]